MKKKLIFSSFFLFLLLLVPSALAGFTDSDDYWTQHYWDSAKSSSIPSSEILAFYNQSSDVLTECTVGSKDLTSQPLILNISTTSYIMLQGSNFFEIRDSSCTNIADLTLTQNTIAPAVAHQYAGEWHILVPLANNTVEQYVFNSSTLTLNQSFTTTNLTNSAGQCNDISSTPYCFYQNTSNDLVRFTLSTGATTSYSLMDAGLVDTSKRAVSIRTWGGSTPSEKVVISGQDSAGETKLCVWNANTESIDATFNTGSCVVVSTGGTDTAYTRVSPPHISDVDGGSTPEITVVYTEKAGATVYNTGMKMYGTGGTVKYSKEINTLTLAGTYCQSYSNPFVLLNGSKPIVCGIGAVNRGGGNQEQDLICLGVDAQTSTAINSIGELDSQIDPCGSGASRLRQIIRADWDSATTQLEILGDNIFANIDLRTGQSITDKNFEFESEYFSAGDLNNDQVLDFVYEKSSTVYLKSGVLTNDLPDWTGTDKFTINGDTPFCINETYTVTAASTAYSDPELQEVRLFIDCYGDERENNTGTAGNELTDDITATCNWNETGTYIMKVYLQDTVQVSQGTASNTNLATKSIVVTDNTDVCNEPGTASSGNVIATADATPAAAFSDTLGDLGLNNGWLLIMWLMVMVTITIALVIQAGVHNPFALGFVNLFLLVMGNILGAVQTSVIVIVSLLIAVVAVISLFTRRGE